MQDRAAVLEAAQPTKRFSDRATQYKAHRPTYPDEVVALFLDEEMVGLKADRHRVADIGSGTGISSLLLLHKGLSVFGVEPNAEMRQEGEDYLREYLDAGKFVSVAAGAEATTLPDHSVDLIMAGQAFHWFKLDETQREWQRIIKPVSESGLKANVVLFWNRRKKEEDKLAEDYEALMNKYCTDYTKVNHWNVSSNKEEWMESFFRSGYQLKSFKYSQELTLEGLLGRTSSSSYCPAPGHPNHGPLMDALKDLFAANASSNGTVTIGYNTVVFYGIL